MKQNNRHIYPLNLSCKLEIKEIDGVPLNNNIYPDPTKLLQYVKGTKIIGKNKEKEHSIVLCAPGISSLATLLKQIWQAITFKCAPRSLREEEENKRIVQDVII